MKFGSFLESLVRQPNLNPENGKAYSIAIFNLKSVHTRCFHLSWLGFLVSFLSWFAFPPLLHGSITQDLQLSRADVANNNICGLCATLVARFALGPLCDRFGPRLVMAGILFVGAIPTALVPLVHDAGSLHVIRFFIGLLGGSFVPCQMWTTIFFEKSIVGRANALVGGWGNAGGGIAFFMMPALVADLQRRGFSLDHSWKYSFLVGPLIILMVVCLMVLVFGQDCPQGKWAMRNQGQSCPVITGSSVEFSQKDEKDPSKDPSKAPSKTQNATSERRLEDEPDCDSSLQENGVITIESPSFLDVVKITFHYRTMLTALAYVTTFGGELAIESVISALYQQHQPSFSQSLAGNWGSMLGLLNVVSRPLGGYISDVLYLRFQTTKAKKFWLLTCGFIEGVFLLWMGLVPDLSIAGLIVAVTVMAFFMEAGNGANFSLVPHINPTHTGIVSGSTGAFGNLGGVLFSLVFRFTTSGTETLYLKGFWIIGICCMGVNALLVFMPVREDRPDGYQSESESA